MSPSTRPLNLDGPSGLIEAVTDIPAQAPRGLAVIAHPHPLYGGSMSNKVVHTLARACVAEGWQALRFNFRGVGRSAGSYDEGRGELQDMLAVVRQGLAQQPDGAALILAGFSFGAFVASQAVAQLHTSQAIERVVLVGTAASRFEVAAVPEALHAHTLVLHGELDDTVPLADVMNWARPQNLPVTVLPGGEHFFHGQLPLLKSLVQRHVR